VFVVTFTSKHKLSILTSFICYRSTCATASCCRQRWTFCSLAALNTRAGHTMDVLSPFIRPLSFRLTLPRRVLSRSWCCPSRPCMAFVVCVHLALFLALSLSLILIDMQWQNGTVQSLGQSCRGKCHYFCRSLNFLITQYRIDWRKCACQKPAQRIQSFWQNSRAVYIGSGAFLASVGRPSGLPTFLGDVNFFFLHIAIMTGESLQ